jgi:hypothetical protein
LFFFVFSSFFDVLIGFASLSFADLRIDDIAGAQAHHEATSFSLNAALQSIYRKTRNMTDVQVTGRFFFFFFFWFSFDLIAIGLADVSLFFFSLADALPPECGVCRRCLVGTH